MKTSKIIAIAVVLGVIILGCVWAYKANAPQSVLTGATSPVGSTFNNAKFAGVTISLASPGANGTSTSMLNTDAYDRYVSSFKVGCEGVGTSKTAYAGTGLANLQVSVGTTTTAAPASFSSFAAIALNFNLGTSTTNLLVSSSTLATATSSLAAVWPTNTYMTFFFNATNTAACTIGTEYFGS